MKNYYQFASLLALVLGINRLFKQTETKKICYYQV